jgi:hypothetical protein
MIPDSFRDCALILAKAGIWTPNMSLHEASRHYKQWALQKHPDKGGNEESFKRIKTCWEMLKGLFEPPRAPSPNSPNRYPNLPSIWWERLMQRGIIEEGISFEEASSRWARWASDHQGRGGDPILFGYMSTSWDDYVEWYRSQIPSQPHPQPQPEPEPQNNMNVNDRTPTRVKTTSSPGRSTRATRRKEYKRGADWNEIGRTKRSTRAKRQPDYFNGRASTQAHVQAAAQAINAAANTGGAKAIAALEVAQANLNRAAEDAAGEGVELNPHVEVAQEAVLAAINAPNGAAAAHAMEVASAHINEAVAAPLRRSTRATRQPDWLNGRRSQPKAQARREARRFEPYKKPAKKSRGARSHEEAAAQAIDAAANTGGANATAALEVAQGPSRPGRIGCCRRGCGSEPSRGGASTGSRGRNQRTTDRCRTCDGGRECTD